MDPLYIAGRSVAIRTYRESDVQEVLAAATESLSEIVPWMSWAVPDYGRSDAEVWVLSRDAAWDADEAYSFIVERVDDGRVVGTVGLNRIDRVHRNANLGYWVRTSETGRGVATEATRLCARYGFEERGLGRIEIVAALDNTASRRVAERAGAEYEGIQRNRMLLRGEWIDGAAYSLIPDDLDG